MSAQENVTNHYSINEASKLTGLPSSTLRYYESIGIIKPVARDSSSKHRVYSQSDLDVLDTIACLNATGMALEDMRTYISNATESEVDFDKQVDLLQIQAERLKLEAEHIKLRQRYVELKIEYWEVAKRGDAKRLREVSARAKQLAQDLKKV
jgi:DNA-binding transcriptional MerR regulator